MKTLFSIIFFVVSLWPCDLYSDYYPWGDMHWRTPVVSLAALPATGNLVGDVRVETTSFGVYVWNGSAWIAFSNAGTTYTFADSVVNIAGTVTLVNDSASPGASKYYGTNGASTLGYFSLPSTPPGGLTSDVQYNNGGVFAGNASFTYDGSGNTSLSGKASSASVNVSGLTASKPVLTDSSKNLGSGTYSGSTTVVATSSGALVNGDCVSIDASGNYVDNGSPCGTGVGGVTSVGFADGSSTPIFTITGSPVITAGTLTETLSVQTQNTILAGPTTGSAAQPTFRALVSADIPNNAANTTGTAANLASPLTIPSPSPSSILMDVSGAYAPIPFPSPSPSGQFVVALGSGNGFGLAAGNAGTVTSIGMTVPSVLSVSPSSITTNGTFALTYSGTALPVVDGGSGQTSALTQYGAIYSASTTAMASTAAGTANYPLVANSSAAPTFQQLSLTAGVTGVLPVGNGGTGIATTPMNGQIPIGNGTDYTAAALTPGSGITITNGSGSASIAETYPIPSPSPSSILVDQGGSYAVIPFPSPGPSGTIPESNGSGGWFAGTATVSQVIPTVQKLTSTGTITGYFFTVTSANATVGATYTNNSNTFTVLATISSGTQLFTSGASAPLASGTLTKSGGTGDATITFSANQALATYTCPSGPAPLYLDIELVGGGGGGSGSGTGSSAGSGGNGTFSIFGTNVLLASGGGGSVASSGGAGGAGGTATVNSPALNLASVAGAIGGGGTNVNSAIGGSGGMGGSSPFGGSGGSTTFENVGIAGAANSGSGGGGAGGGSTTGELGAGGGAGGYIHAIIPSPSNTYYYSVGAAGSLGSAGTTGHAGGAGGTGVVIVKEVYQ